MTKDEILAVVANHSSVINSTLGTVASVVDAMVKDCIPPEHQPDMIVGLKASIDYVKSAADEIKAALGQWPE